MNKIGSQLLRVSGSKGETIFLNQRSFQVQGNARATLSCRSPDLCCWIISWLWSCYVIQKAKCRQTLCYYSWQPHLFSSNVTMDGMIGIQYQFVSSVLTSQPFHSVPQFDYFSSKSNLWLSSCPFLCNIIWHQSTIMWRLKVSSLRRKTREV